MSQLDDSKLFSTRYAAKKAELAQFGQIILEALRGSHRSYTEGSLGQAILVLAIPMVLEMLMEGIFAVVDIFFVGKLGVHAVATVGITETILSMIYMLAIGFGIAVTAVVARRVGENKPRDAAKSAGQALILGVIVSTIIAIFGTLASHDILTFMGGSPEVLNYGLNYTRIMIGGNFVIITLFLANSIARGAGDGHIAMRSLWLANSINIALGPCLIFGLGPFPQLGLTGAATATTIGRGIGTLYVLSRLFRPGGRIRIYFSDLKYNPELFKNIVKLSGPGIAQQFTNMASWICLMKIVSSFGSAAVAGYTIGIRIILFILLPAMGLSNAAATLVGQSLGANDPKRAEAAVWKAGFFNFCALGLVGLCFFIFAHPIIRIFSQEPETYARAVECLRIILLGFPFFAYGIVVSQSFNGAGDTITPMRINFFVFWMVEIPVAYALTRWAAVGPKGVFWATSVAFTILAFISVYYFKRGQWKLKSV